jgi:radical SAM protein with 4Fe4S-binding SPASM domain
VISSLCRDNEADLEAMVKFARELGVHSLKINPVTPGGRGRTFFEKKGCDVETLVKLAPVAEKEWTERHGIRVIFSLPMAFHSFDDIANNRIGRCHILNIIGLLADGSVSICGIGKTEPDLVAGVAGGTPLEEIWKNGAVFRDLRANLPKKLGGACRKCIFKGTCLGHCLAVSYTMFGDLYSGYWICDVASEKGLLRKSRHLVDERELS